MQSIEDISTGISKGSDRNSDSVFFNCEHLGEIILHSTIKHIGEGAFMQSKIKSINLPKGLLSIGNNAFYGSSFEELTIPASCQYIGKNAFAGNYELKRLA